MQSNTTPCVFKKGERMRVKLYPSNSEAGVTGQSSIDGTSNSLATKTIRLQLKQMIQDLQGLVGRFG